ncbi:MAG: glycosyltransferase family 9 protein [Elusimicrobiota bacterium]|jgi:ADP-heptose:LPS heptosyltransferase|nr:glycosyltransferase family 9 protein [Elusimicrobiota bacterium]
MQKIQYNNILISVTAHMGDFIWATSAFACLKKTYPQIKITIMAPKTIKDLIIDNPIIDDAVYCPYSDGDSKSRIKKFLWAFMIAPKLFLKKFDAAFIFDSSRAAIMAVKLALMPKIVGADLFFGGYDIADPAAKYYTDKIELVKNQDDAHVSTRYQTIIKSFFGIYNNAMPIIPDSSKYAYKAIELIKNDNSALKVAVCVRGNRTSLNRWDINNFKKVIEDLDNKFEDISFYLIGTADAFEYSQTIVDKANIYNVCGKTSILELKEFLKKMNLLISSDTGVVHMAALAGIDIVSLHGYTSPCVTGAMSHKVKAFHRAPECFPCAYRIEIEKIPCFTYPNPKCFQLIKPQEVSDAAIKILERIKNE